MGMSVLPDMCTLVSRAAGLQEEGAHVLPGMCTLVPKAAGPKDKGAHVLPDMCTLVPRAAGQGTRVHISGRTCTLMHMLQLLCTVCRQTSA